MDWWSTFSIILVILSVGEEAVCSGRKKIRIHIPNKVKHIHHHKKIYITKHVTQPTSFVPQYVNAEQYASGYAASSEVSSSSLAPIVSGLEPGRKPAPGSSPAPNIQPLYRARGHYGPPPSEQSKRKVRVIKISDGKKKRIVIKKPKKIIINTSSSAPSGQESNPPSNYHDEFYSDVGDKAAAANTFKTVKKPKRVEKYVDGDGEHIHTYSEEHIHQIVYDDRHQANGNNNNNGGGGQQHASVPVPALVPLDVAVMHSSQLPATSVIPGVLSAPLEIQSAQLHPMDAFIGGMPSIGTLGTPAHLEYMHYNPHDVTHDHIIHDHGEIVQTLPAEIKLPGPPKSSYTPQGIRMSANYDNVKHETKEPHRPDFAYYENFYPPKSSKPKYKDESSSEEFTPYYKKKQKTKPTASSIVYGNSGSGQSSTHKPRPPKSIRHHKVAENKPVTSYIENHSYTGFKNNKQPTKYKHYTSVYSGHEPEYPSDYQQKPRPSKKHKHHSWDSDAFASTQEHKKEKKSHKHRHYAAEPEKDTTVDPMPLSWRNKKNKSKKSVSTQNISFGGQEHKMIINHQTSIAIGSAEPRAVDSELQESLPQPSTATYSPLENYYNSVSIPESSNTNFRIVEAPKIVEYEPPSSTTTTTLTPPTAETPTADALGEVSRPPKRQRKKANEKARKTKSTVEQLAQSQGEPKQYSNRGKFKYGDRLNERYDYEYDDVVFV